MNNNENLNNNFIDFSETEKLIFRKLAEIQQELEEDREIFKTALDLRMKGLVKTVGEVSHLVSREVHLWKIASVGIVKRLVEIEQNGANLKERIERIEFRG